MTTAASSYTSTSPSQIFASSWSEAHRAPGDRLSRPLSLEGVDDLLTVGAHMDDASALAGELMCLQCWHWIAEHQRVDNPHGRMVALFIRTQLCVSSRAYP